MSYTLLPVLHSVNKSTLLIIFIENINCVGSVVVSEFF